MLIMLVVYDFSLIIGVLFNLGAKASSKNKVQRKGSKLQAVSLR
jgi:hypothetical protein